MKVRFPGEPGRATKRFQMRSQDYSDKYLEQRRSRSYLVAAVEAGEQTPFFIGMTIGNATAIDGRFHASFHRQGGTESSQSLLCQATADDETYACESDDAPGTARELVKVRAMQFEVANIDVQGTVDILQNGLARSYAFAGDCHY